MKLSNRIQKVGYSAIRELIPYERKAKENGKKIYELNIGAPDVSVPDVYYETFKTVKKGALPYAQAQGLPELRKATAKYYKNRNINFDADDIFITNGASEALLFTFETIADYGEEILTTNPFYTNYMTAFDQLGINIETFDTDPNDGFALPEEKEIEKHISDKTVGILLSNPTNPTGALYSEEEIERICKIAKKYDLYIVADEVYREFVYDGNKYKSFGEVEGIEENLILIDSISKRFGACGARIGSVASKNEEFKDGINKLCNSRLAVPTIEQMAAARLYDIDESYFKEVNEEYQKRRDLIYEELINIPGVTVKKPKGAFYVMPKLPVDDTEKFAIWMLENFDIDGETIMFAPAKGFFKNQEDGKQMIRLAFILNTEDLKKSMKILREGIKAYVNENE
ncbi:pyridoxal phosphate-dependent aminotransferase [Peptoniphilus lacydonensis]|uniref:pyridoxal phosphate-dependent aminotransferase n=1 Tax=Peptoniphilus lacydonensis TaxID=1673725 RepID=UPI0029154AA5|nr:pyridoxal phosphate-dependent aminotransferase [Peptoniphilus lacydonensis]MDU5274546.1 pyridoxal phosphate-dependent aminotransferase [Peptoniphilus lacydonensis]